MRRILLVVIIIGVLGTLAAGTAWYFYRNTTEKLLVRSELAIRAKQYDRALELAESVIAKEPKNWRGYYMRSQAYSNKGQYDEARRSLAEAAQCNPPGVAVDLALADTYAVQARRTLASDEPSRQVAALTTALSQLRQANDSLAKVRAEEEAGKLDIQQAVGFNLSHIATAQRLLVDRLDKEVQVAETAGDKTGARAKRVDRDAAKAEQAKSLESATATLLDVIKRDPKRAMAASALVEMCTRQENPAALAAARQVILAQEDPPTAAAVMLIMRDARSAGESYGAPDEATDLAAATAKLEGLLAKHPKDSDALLARAEIALRMSDPDKCIEICKKVLDAKPEQEHRFRASLLHAHALMMQNKWPEAEQELHSVKTEAPHVPAAHYAYAIAADATGKKELAREAMRTVTQLDPDHAGARRYLAESLLAAGFASEALPDARAYYESHPDDVTAVRLYVQAAKQTSQENLARQILESAAKANPSRPDMLMVVYEGYVLLNDPANARKALEAAAVAGRRAVARAWMHLARTSEAEKSLTEELVRNPKDARVPEELGRLYSLTGRQMQAVEQYRAAVRLDERNLLYRQMLAMALYDGGMFDECEAEAAAILQSDPSHVAARWLSNQVKGLKGVRPEEMPLPGGDNLRASLAAAQACLSRGRVDECIRMCQEELKKTPTDRAMRVLLGQAYLTLGQDDKCIEQWTTVLVESPDPLPVYLQLAAVLAKSAKPEQVEAALAAIPGAKRQNVDLAIGWLYERQGQYDAAAEAYGRLAVRKEASQEVRDRARVLRAQALTRAQHPDLAILELDQVGGGGPVRAEALYTKALLLASADRFKEADTILTAMGKQAVKEKDVISLERVISLYSRMKETDKALASCGQLDPLLPNEARPCLVRAEVLAAAGRLAETATLLQKAIDRQPGNLDAYLALARTLDQMGKSQEAKGVLEKLKGISQTGRATALFEQGATFARWGLQAQAADCFEQLAALGYASDPGVQLSLGRAFAALGKKDRAGEILAKIPPYAPQYVTARQILAEVADKEEVKLAVLRQVQKEKPNVPALLVQEMSVLLRANRPADAVKAFQAYIARQPGKAAISDDARILALQAMITTNNMAAASDLAARAATETRAPRWVLLALLLTPEDKPEAAKAWLPDPKSAGPYEAFLGLALAAQTGQPVAPWHDRLNQIQQTLSQANPPRSMPTGYQLLGAAITGSRAEAAAALPKIEASAGVSREAAEEFVASLAKNPKAAEEATRLLKASVAFEIGMFSLAQGWSLQALKARPACQWAAAIAMQTAPEPALQQEILRTLQPRDCLVARTLQARLAFEQKQYDQAVEIWREAAKADAASPVILTNLAMALEQAGRLQEALPLYRKAWETTKSPVAGNNAAYLVTVLHAQDQAKLAEARQWMEAVVKSAPDVPAYRDTLGWVACLQGRTDEAVQSLRLAIMGMPGSPEVHFHLGQAEAAAGRKDLAAWHFAATVSLAEKLKADGAPTAGAEQAAKLAREALAKLEQSKS
jgi:tetratricopeptide (TPR) repeat protein